MTDEEEYVEQTYEEHKKRHEELHAALDELLADFISHTEKLPSQTSVLELAKWSMEQMNDPTTKVT